MNLASNTDMKITNDLRKAINAGIRQLCGATPLAEVGLRESEHSDRWTANGLNWTLDADLGDLCRFAHLSEIDDCPELPGAATLDLYVTSGTGSARELETNVYVTIKDGKLADIHRTDLDSDKRTFAILGRSFSKETP